MFECKGAPRQRDVVELVIDRAYITFVNLCVLKDKFGYSVRDYMYYKKRCGTDLASLELIDYEHQARAMIVDNELERKVRIIMAKEPQKELSVSITPIKRPREQQQEDLPCVQGDLDAYKVWLRKLKKENPNTGVFLHPLFTVHIHIPYHTVLTFHPFLELKDEFRQQTIETYKHWLTLQGDLPGTNNFINFYLFY